MALDIDCIAYPIGVFSSENMVKSNFIEGVELVQVEICPPIPSILLLVSETTTVRIQVSNSESFSNFQVT